MTWILDFIIGIGAGVLAGLFGIGGGTLMVPALVMLGLSPSHAIATSLLAIWVTSTSGTFYNSFNRLVNLRIVLWIAVPSILFAQIGVWLIGFFEPNILLILFSCLIVFNLWMFSRPKIQGKVIGTPNAQKIKWILFGSLSGLLSGFFGVGGGIVLVPLLMAGLGFDYKTSVRTSLAVICITAVGGALGHSIEGRVDWLTGFVLGFGGLVGAQISTRMLGRLKESLVKLGFVLLNVLIGLWMLYQGLTTS